MRTAAHIIETVGKLVKKYDTRDPYELCKCLEIKIHFYNLEKKLKGFFFYQSRQKNIVIDSNVNDVLERILIAHELGHAVLHTKIAMMKGFQEMEVLDGRSQDEDEANFFAAELLLEDKEVLECLSKYSFFETAKQLYVPAALLDYKFSLLHEKGELVSPMYIRKTKFLKDDLGHGSACAYTIKSIFPETQFYIIKILDQNLETVYPVLEAALEHCMDLKYHIINLSLSLLEEVGSVNLKLICDALQKKGKIIVASVSNGHRQSFPAAYPSVIGVRGSFFSSSEEYWYNSKEDIQCIADISPTFTSWTLDNYFMFSGNSRACAVISGLLLKLETDYNMILNLESAGLILEKNATRNDWTENDIVAFTDTYVIGHQQVCDQSVLVAVHQILSDIMGWGDNIVVDLNTNLFKNGLIHTNKIKQLIIDLEKQFGITINHSNIKYTSLCSINSIGKLIGGIVDEKTKIDS